MKKIIWLLPILILLLPISFVYADTGDGGVILTIVNNTIYGVDYYEVIAGTNSTGLNITVESFFYTYGNANDLILCPKTVYVEDNGTNVSYQTNCRLNINMPTKTIPIKKQYIDSLKNITNSTSTFQLVDSVVLEKYLDCMNVRETIQGQKVLCEEEKRSLNNSNNDLLTCTSNLATSTTSCSNKDTQITTLQKQIDDTKNTPWVYGVVGLIIGVAGYAFYTGKIGGARIRRPEDQFNRGQAA